MGHVATAHRLTGISSLTRDAECRASFGPEAHWCTTLEISKIPDVLALPEDFMDVRATPPVTGIDWVTGINLNTNYPVTRVRRNGADAPFASAQLSVPSPMFACCMEPPAP